LYTNIGVNVGNAVANYLDFEFSLKNVALLQPNPSRIEPLFLECLLNVPRLKRSILERASVGGAQKFISLQVLRSLEIIAPSIELQREFVHFVERLNSLRHQIEAGSSLCEKIFLSLQNRAFDGRLVRNKISEPARTFSN
jgi:type I restriction enzyme S subunit